MDINLIVLMAVLLVGVYLERKIRDIAEKVDQIYEWNGGDDRVGMDFNRDMEKSLSEITRKKTK